MTAKYLYEVMRVLKKVPQNRTTVVADAGVKSGLENLYLQQRVLISIVHNLNQKCAGTKFHGHEE